MSPPVVDIELPVVGDALSQDHLHRVVVADSVGSQVGDVAESGVRSNRSARYKPVKVSARGDDVRAFVGNIADLQAEVFTQGFLDVEVPVLHVGSIPIPL